MDPFIGEIRALPYGFVPANWMACDGSVLPVNRYATLFSIIGTQFGGDGTSTFALPDLRGCTALGAGQGPGLSNRQMGDRGGAESVALDYSTMPMHQHSLNAAPAGRSGGGVTPVEGGYLASPAATVKAYADPAKGKVAPLDQRALASAGASLPHENRQPFQVVQYCIAMDGMFPPRS